jgi:tetratricopeptide (TPR) repeat protein
MAMAEATALFNSANEFCAVRRCGDAVAFWEQASSLRPADPDIHYQLGFCYAGGCGVQCVLDPEIAIFHYRRALTLAAPDNTIGRAMVLGALGNAYVSASKRGGVLLTNAVHCYEEAAENYAKAGQLDDWAREQFNLGNVWCDMPEETYPEKWNRAIKHYTRVLSVRTRWTDSPHYVATLQNMGTAYRQMKGGNPSASIRKAIDCYHRALRALRGAAPSRKRGDLHHNLGNAYLSLAGAGEDCARNCLRAIRHFARALAMRTRDESPFDFAAAQFSRGQAHLRLAAQGVGVTSNLDTARICFVEAIDAFLRSGHTELAQEAIRQLETLPEREIP